MEFGGRGKNPSERTKSPLKLDGLNKKRFFLYIKGGKLLDLISFVDLN